MASVGARPKAPTCVKAVLRAAVPAQSAVGDTVPQDVNLRPMPSEIGLRVPQIKAHRFVYTAERILIVDPKDNRVAEVVETRGN